MLATSLETEYRSKGLELGLRAKPYLTGFMEFVAQIYRSKGAEIGSWMPCHAVRLMDVGSLPGNGV